MPDATTTLNIVDGAAAATEALVPVVAPFTPLIALVLTAIRAHYNATKRWPSEEEVRAAVPVDYQDLQTLWAKWDASKAPKA